MTSDSVADSKAPFAPRPFMLEVMKEVCRYYLEHVQSADGDAEVSILDKCVADLQLAWATLHDELCEQKKQLDVGAGERTLRRMREGMKELDEPYIVALTNNLAHAIDRLLQDREAMTVSDIASALSGSEALRRALSRDVSLEKGLLAAERLGLVVPDHTLSERAFRASEGTICEQHENVYGLWGTISEYSRCFLAIAAREFHEVSSPEFQSSWSRRTQPRAKSNRIFWFRFAAPRCLRPERITLLYHNAINRALERLERRLRDKYGGSYYHVEGVMGLTHEKPR